MTGGEKKFGKKKGGEKAASLVSERFSRSDTEAVCLEQLRALWRGVDEDVQPVPLLAESVR